jgi:HK97 family phage major capsid protein
MSRIKELQEKRATAHAAAVEFLKGEQTSETRVSYEKAIKVVDDLGADIKNIERAEAIEAELRGTKVPPTTPVADPNAQVDVKKLSAEYRRAFIGALRKGNVPENGQWSGMLPRVKEILDRGVEYEREQRNREEQEQRDGLVEGSPAAMVTHIGTYTGLGYFVPTGFVNDIEQATKWFAPLIDGTVINIMDTATGQPLPYPTSNDTAQRATVVGEASEVSEQDVTAGQIIFGAIKLTSGLVKASLEILQDSAFDLDAWLVQRFAERWGRGLEYYLTVGNSNGLNLQPTGLLPAILAANASGTALATVTAAGKSETTGVSSSIDTGANSIGYTDLVRLEHSVDPSYRRGAKYMFHDSTLAALKKIIDKYGRPLWTPGVGVGVSDTINGYSYVINQSMPVIAASAVTVVFGAFKKFTARRVKDLTVMKLVERYAEYGQIGFVSFARLDSQLVDAGTHPLNTLTQSS